MNVTRDGIALPCWLGPDTCSVQQIAMVCHEANRAYCESIGDDSQKSWADAEQWQRDSAIEGVTKISLGAVRGPDDSHEAWRRNRIANGWTHGEVKDPAAKTHPCLVPFDALPDAQRAKDLIFWNIANAMLGRAVPPMPMR